MSKKPTGKYTRALATHRHLQRVSKKEANRFGSGGSLSENNTAYQKANKAANDTYNKLSRAEKARFALDGRAARYRP